MVTVTIEVEGTGDSITIVEKDSLAGTGAHYKLSNLIQDTADMAARRAIAAATADAEPE